MDIRAHVRMDIVPFDLNTSNSRTLRIQTFHFRNKSELFMKRYSRFLPKLKNIIYRYLHTLTSFFKGLHAPTKIYRAPDTLTEAQNPQFFSTCVITTNFETFF